MKKIKLILTAVTIVLSCSDENVSEVLLNEDQQMLIVFFDDHPEAEFIYGESSLDRNDFINLIKSLGHSVWIQTSNLQPSRYYVFSSEESLDRYVQFEESQFFAKLSRDKNVSQVKAPFFLSFYSSNTCNGGSVFPASYAVGPANGLTNQISLPFYAKSAEVGVPQFYRVKLQRTYGLPIQYNLYYHPYNQCQYLSPGSGFHPYNNWEWTVTTYYNSSNPS